MRNYTGYKDEITRLKTHRNELIERYKTALLRHNRRESRRLWELRQRVEQALMLKQIRAGQGRLPVHRRLILGARPHPAHASNPTNTAGSLRDRGDITKGALRAAERPFLVRGCRPADMSEGAGLDAGCGSFASGSSRP